MSNRLRANRSFEDDVRRVAEAVWGLQVGECQPAHYTVDPVLHELDGLAELRDITHVLMVTTSTRLDKVKSDVVKLAAADKLEKKRRGVPVAKWLITKDQLEAVHITHSRSNGVTVLTLAQFKQRFFDGRGYVDKRRVCTFGSARNLRDDTIAIPEDEFVELPMTVTRMNRPGGQGKQAELSYTLQQLTSDVESGHTVVLVGPFGAGKSLTVRELFLRLSKVFSRRSESLVPVAINLREHWGALYADEILDRHARTIGFTPRENIVSAWRAGMAILLVDGFDEVASQAIARTSDRNFMRQARREALQAVRDLLSKIPPDVGIVVAGRDHYFDNLDELSNSLGVGGREYALVRLNEFTEAQATSFLKKYATSSSLPDWLPRKPLILGYLAHRNLLDPVLAIDGSKGFGFAWDEFLRLVCAREAMPERATMDPETVRRVLERLASDVRSTASGIGPLSGLDLAEAYRVVTGDVAGEGVLMQLQRLPGLTPREQDPAARSFVDDDMLSALQGGDLARIVVENLDTVARRAWLTGLSPDAIRMCVHVLETQGVGTATLLAVAERASRQVTRAGPASQLVADVLAVAIEMARDDGRIDAHDLVVSEAHLKSLDLQELEVHNVSLEDMNIDELFVGEALGRSTISFDRCLIGTVHGVQGAGGLPKDMFRQSEIERFDDASTTAAVLRLPLAPAMKALLTMLRKLYIQAGGGRKVSALRRGLPTGAVYDCVSDVLRILESEGVVAVTNEVAHPIRRNAGRVRAILEAGALSNDPIVERVRELE